LLWTYFHYLHETLEKEKGIGESRVKRGLEIKCRGGALRRRCPLLSNQVPSNLSGYLDTQSPFETTMLTR